MYRAAVVAPGRRREADVLAAAVPEDGPLAHRVADRAVRRVVREDALGGHPARAIPGQDVETRVRPERHQPVRDPVVVQSTGAQGGSPSTTRSRPRRCRAGRPDGGQDEDSNEPGETAPAACRGTLHGIGRVTDRRRSVTLLRTFVAACRTIPAISSRSSGGLEDLDVGAPAEDPAPDLERPRDARPPGQRSVVAGLDAARSGASGSRGLARQRPARSAGRPRRRAGRR